MNHTRTAIPVFALGDIPLRAGAFVSMVLLLVAACGTKAPDATGGSGSKSQPRLTAERTPIDPEVVQEEVERQESFEQLRKATCPRRIPDRNEERRPFPAIDILHGLEYVTISDDSSRGKYEKVIELTNTGRQGLGSDLEEEPDRYVITIARREYLPGLESFEKAPGRDDKLVVSFRWQWKPLNPLGERLNLFAPYSDRPEHQGRATYVLTTEGWKFDELWLDRDARDYVRGLYK